MRISQILSLNLLLIFTALASSQPRNFCFDMGTADSPSMPGFIQITERSGYSEALGYGWIDPPEQTFSESLRRLTDDLTRDGVVSEREMRFRIDAPKGDYFLTLTFGAGNDERTAMRVMVNGNPVETVATPWNRLPYRTLRQKMTTTGSPIIIQVIPDSLGAGIHGIELGVATEHMPIDFTSDLDSDTAAVAATVRRLETHLQRSPENIATSNQLNLLKKYLRAVYYFDIGWWSWAVKETGLSQFPRFWYASDVLRQIIADESHPLYYRAAYLLGKIHYWLYLEQGEKWNRLEAEKFFEIVASKFPKNEIVRMYLGDKIPHAGPCDLAAEDAPQWAVKQREALCRMIELIHWWVDNRQVENGEMGGKFGDDVEMLRWWMPAILGADDAKSKLGFKRLAEGVWNSGVLKRAYSSIVEDVEHSAEPFTDTHSALFMMEYGNPKYVERALISMQNFRDVWTGINDYGHRHFKSSYLSADSVVQVPPLAVDVAMNARATLPGLWLAWYNQNPTLIQLFSEWGKAWVADARRTDKGKPAGILPAAVSFAKDEIGGYSQNWYHPNLGWDYYEWQQLGTIIEMHNQLLGMHLFTGDAEFLYPVQQTFLLVEKELQMSSGASPKPGSDRWAAQVLLGKFGNEISDSHAFSDLLGKTKVVIGDDRYDEFLKENGNEYVRYLLSGEKSFLTAGCEKVIESLKYNFPLKTTEVKFTDRVYVRNSDHLFSMMTGGVGRGGDFPSAAVTYQNTGSEVASLVSTADRRSLTVHLYNFGGEKILGLRLWRLEEGRYRLQTGIDTNDDDLIDRDKSEREFAVTERGQPMEVILASGQLTIVELRQVEKSTEVAFPRPDVAVSVEDISFSNLDRADGAEVTITARVHNIGNTDAKNVRVEFLVDDASVGKEIIEVLEAPNDLELRSMTCGVKWNANRGKHSIVVKVSASEKEITRTNNQAGVSIAVD